MAAQLNFPLLQLVRDARSTYGLRHQDYDRYSSHCAGKVHYLRKSAGLGQVGGKSKKYSKKDVTDANASDKTLQIALFDCERAWSQSQALKAQLANSDTPASTKHHLQKRLSKAVSRSNALQALVLALGERVPASQVAETIAYALTLKGTHAFQTDKHQAGLESLSLAHDLLTKIAAAAGSAQAEARANEVIDEVEPMLRFCAYELGISTANGFASLVDELVPRVKNSVPTYDAVVAQLQPAQGGTKEAVGLEWRGKQIAVRNATLVEVVVKVKQSLASLEADGGAPKVAAEGKKAGPKKAQMGARRMGTFDKALAVLGEAEDVARGLVDDNKVALSQGSSTRSSSATAPLVLIHSFLSYQLLSVRVKRDLLLLSTTQGKLAAKESAIAAAEAAFVEQHGTVDPAKAKAKVDKQRARAYPGMVKLFEGVLAGLESIREIEAVEEDGDLASLVQARITYVKANRALYLSRAHALVANFPQSLSLNSRAKLYARESRALASSLTDTSEDYPDDADFVGDLLSLSPESLAALDAELEADSGRFSLDWHIATGGRVGVEDEIEDLTLEEGDKKEDKKKVPFYDVAFNYVAAFDLEAIGRRARGEEDPVEGEEEQAEEPIEEEDSPAAGEQQQQKKGGASQSQPTTARASLEEKFGAQLAPATARRPAARSAEQLLAELSLGRKASATAALTLDSIQEWDKTFETSEKHKLAQMLLSKSDFTVGLTQAKAVVADQHVYNVAIDEEGTPVTNQKSSGRCWLFATTNVLRVPFIKEYKLKEFQFSQSYLFFYDSLSKANYALEQMLDLADSPIDDRTVNYLLSQSQNDGGQMDMAINLLDTFGLVPQCVYPESFTSSATGKIDGLLTSKTREYALELRALHDAAMDSLSALDKPYEAKRSIAIQSARKRKEEQMEEIYRILAISCGTPPKPTESFTWEYTDKDKKYHSITTTPVEFYKKFVKTDMSRGISLVNDPRNDYNTVMTVDRLGNVVGGRPVLYVNAEIQALKDAAITALKAGLPVWFGCDVGKSSSSSLALMDTNLYDLKGAFSTELGMDKKQRLLTGDSAMTHAMVLTAVHLDKDGKSVRWRVENSWGPDACKDGYFLMTDEWFDMNVYQVVVDRKLVDPKLKAIFEGEVDITLPPYDPMGALA